MIFAALVLVVWWQRIVALFRRWSVRLGDWGDGRADGSFRNQSGLTGRQLLSGHGGHQAHPVLARSRPETTPLALVES